MADQEQVEEKQMAVYRMLYEQSRDSLLFLLEHLDLKDELQNISELSRPMIVKEIIRYLECDEVTEASDCGLSVYSKLSNRLLQNLEKSDSVSSQQIETDRNRLTIQTPLSKFYPSNKDLKIYGQIGEAGQKDKLTYINLTHQLQVAQDKGYTDKEIIMAVIRSVTQGLGFRSYLEGRYQSGMTLAELRTILRFHFDEKEASDLYTELTNATQGQKETSQNFLVRCLDLRQKVQLASKETNSGISYDPTLAKNLFLQSLETGLRSESIRNYLIPFLRNKSVTDDILFSEMNKAVSLDTERRKKTGQLKLNTVKVAALSNQDDEREGNPTTTLPGKPQKGHLMEQIAELKADLASIKLSIAESAQRGPGASNDRRSRPNRQRGCSDCRYSNQGRYCDHCFLCGSRDHWKSDCVQNRRSGNENRSRRRDEL